MKKLMFMISTEGKSKEQVTREALEAFRKYKKAQKEDSLSLEKESTDKKPVNPVTG